jgi:hypothetical protein
MVVANPLIPVHRIQPVLSQYAGGDTRGFQFATTRDLWPQSRHTLHRIIAVPNYPPDSPYGPNGKITPRCETGQFVNICA